MNSEAVLRLTGSLSEPTETPAAAVPETATSAECPPTDPMEIVESDEILLTAVGRGSHEALSTLFLRHGSTVRGVAQRILKDESEAEDLRQDVFLYLFERAQFFDARKASALSWIIQITYHRAIDRRRYLIARQHYTVEEFGESHAGQYVCHLSSDLLDARDIWERLQNDLSPEQRKALELHTFYGYSFQEIAEQSEQVVGNIRHYYYRGLERLRSNLFSKKRG